MLSFSSDGQFLISISWYDTVRLWDSSTGALHGIFEVNERELALSLDCQLLASLLEYDTLRSWDLNMGTLRAALRSFAFD